MAVDPRKIQARRHKLKLTQKQCADAAGFETPQAWSNIERGVVDDPRISTVERIAAALACSVNDLLAEAK